MTSNKYPQFEATEQNIMSIIDMLIYYEQATNKTPNQVIKKYTEISCGDLAALIKTLVPDAEIVLGLAYKLEEIDNLAYHFMVEIKDPKNPKSKLYYDINGRHEREGLEEYVASILNKNSQDIGFISKGQNPRVIEKDNTPAIECLKGITTWPHVISNEYITK